MYVEDKNSPDHQVDSSRYNSKSCLLNKIGQPKTGGGELTLCRPSMPGLCPRRDVVMLSVRTGESHRVSLTSTCQIFFFECPLYRCKVITLL